jgi:hypothetical protein
MVKPIILLVFLWILNGCYDRFYGPSLRNDFDSEIEVKVIFSNGDVSENVWPPCFSAFVGKGDDPESSIKEIIIKREGVVIYQLDFEQIRDLAEQERKTKVFLFGILTMKVSTL